MRTSLPCGPVRIPPSIFRLRSRATNKGLTGWPPQLWTCWLAVQCRRWVGARLSWASLKADLHRRYRLPPDVAVLRCG